MQISHMDLKVLYGLLNNQQQEICDLSEKLLRMEQELYKLRPLAAQNGEYDHVHSSAPKS